MDVDQPSKPLGSAVTVRGLSPGLKARLRIRAAHNARSMEAEARAILEAALSAPDDESIDISAFARGLFAPLGGVELELPARSLPRQPPRLDDVSAATAGMGGVSAAVASPTPEPIADVSVTPVPASPRKGRR